MAAAPELIIAGNTCVDLYLPAHERPPAGGIRLISAPQVEVGGNGANTAITAARLGVRTALAGVLGDDLFGRHLRDALLAEGVRISWLELLPGRPSPLTLVLNDAGGERSFVHHPGTNAEFAVPTGAVLAPCRVFHLAAPELLPGLWPEGAIELGRKLKAAGRTLSLDVFAVDDPPGSAESIARQHRPLLELADMAFPNEAEARLVTGQKELRSMAAYFHDCGVGLVAIKRGPAGACVSSGGRLELVPTRKAAVVDTCGAGDSFSGAFLAGWLRGLDPVECTRLGCALGTLCVEHRGALAGSRDSGRLRQALGAFAFPGPPPITGGI
jgi:sugar/nucleoside kinase (ribokinase family)